VDIELGSAEEILMGWDLEEQGSREAGCSDVIESISVDDSEFSGCCSQTPSEMAGIVLEASQYCDTWVRLGVVA